MKNTKLDKTTFINKAKSYIDYFDSNNDKSYVLEKGIGCVMISSPHSVEHLRNSELRPGEKGTGILAKLLHDSLNCPVIYKTSNCNDDANYDLFSSYKDELLSYIKNNDINYLIDLHQLDEKRSVLINIGTGEGNNLKDNKVKEFIQEKLSEYGFTSLIDKPYAGKSERTISSFISNNFGIETMQIEINGSISKFNTKKLDNEYKLYCALSDIIFTLNSFTKKKTDNEKIVDDGNFLIKQVYNFNGNINNERKFNASRENLKVVYLSNSLVKYFDDEELVALKKDDKYIEYATVKYSDELDTDEIGFSFTLKRKLKIENKKQINIDFIKFNTLEYEKIKISDFDSLKGDNKVIICGPKEDYKNFINKNKFILFNKKSKFSIIVNYNHIVFEESEFRSIRLSRKYRNQLGYDSPLYINKGDVIESDLINKYYTKEDDILVLREEPFGIDAERLKNELSKSSPVCIVPVLNEETEKNTLSNIWNSIIYFWTNFFIRKRSISLKVIRPIPSDESNNVVRMSISNMRLLGLNETEQVILTYKNKKYICRVLEQVEEESLRRQNKSFNAELAISVPAAIRNELDVDVYSSIKVERDTKYIYMKELGSQITSYIISWYVTSPSNFLANLVSTNNNSNNESINWFETVIDIIFGSTEIKIILLRMVPFILLIILVRYMQCSSRRAEVK